MIQTSNQRDSNLLHWNQQQTRAKEPLKHFFLERYDESFYYALDEFYTAIIQHRAPQPSAADGRAALAIALACAESSRSGCLVAPMY